MQKIIIFIVAASMFQMATSCKTNTSTVEEVAPVVSVKTRSVIMGDIENSITFNGKTVYLKKNIVVSPISGYVTEMNARYGETVHKNDLLFEIQTKESKALEGIAPFNNNGGIIKISAPAGGTINELNINETGGYVVEGTAMCSIIEPNDLVIQMNLPFQYNALVRKDMKCKIILPDRAVKEGYVYKILPIVDALSQTQNVLLRPVSDMHLPENLNLLVQFIHEKHYRSFLTVKSAVITDETQSEFWVMKIVGNNLAVRIPVNKGIVNDTLVEISSPDLFLNDLLISEGAYGLTDSSFVKIEK